MYPFSCCPFKEQNKFASVLERGLTGCWLDPFLNIFLIILYNSRKPWSRSQDWVQATNSLAAGERSFKERAAIPMIR